MHWDRNSHNTARKTFSRAKWCHSPPALATPLLPCRGSLATHRANPPPIIILPPMLIKPMRGAWPLTRPHSRAQTTMNDHVLGGGFELGTPAPEAGIIPLAACSKHYFLPTRSSLYILSAPHLNFYSPVAFDHTPFALATNGDMWGGGGSGSEGRTGAPRLSVPYNTAQRLAPPALRG